MGFFNKLFGSNEKKKEREAKAALHRVFDHTLQILNDDTKQNALMPEELQQAMVRGGVCDILAAAKGPFGRTPENPIPVNGPLGEITYLSRLITAGNGQRVGFHRLGSMKAIDVYEVVSTDGESWDILFFDYYHAGKSKKVPDGYAFASRVEGVTGTNRFNPCFPSQLRDHAMRCSSSALGVPMPHPELKVFESQKFSRSKDHAELFYAALDLICAVNHQLSLEKRFAELDKRIEEGEYDTEKFLARDVIRQALIFVGSPAVAWIRMEPVMPISYRNDRTCLELCCAMCAVLSSALDKDEIYIRQEVLFHLYRDLYDFFGGYTKEFFTYMRNRVAFYREKLALPDSMELSFALVDSIIDANNTLKDDRQDHIETFISPVAFLMTNMEQLIKNVRSYIETEFIPCKQAFAFQAADPILIDLRDALAGFFQKEFDHALDDERLAAFVDTFPVLVFETGSFYTPSNRIFASSYFDGKLMAFLNKKCLFPEVLDFCDNLSDYATLFWSAFDFEALYLDHLDFIDFDDLVKELSEGKITELSDLEADKLRLIFCSAANAVAAVFALPGKITLDFNAEDLAEHEADLHESSTVCMEQVNTVHETTSGKALPNPLINWEDIYAELETGVPDDAVFNQVAPESIEEEYSASLKPGRHLLAQKARLPDNALGAGGQGLLPHVPRFDLSLYFTVYKTIRMQDGYILDYVYAADGHGGEPFLYARAIDSPALKNVEAYCAAYNPDGLGMLLGADPTIKTSYPYLEKLEPENGKYAAFERALFCMTARRFYLFWHSLYNARAYISTRKELLAMQRDSVGGHSTQEYDAMLNMDFLPKVITVGPYQRVSIFNYEQNTGYSWLHVYFKNQFFVKMKNNVVLESKTKTFY